MPRRSKSHPPAARPRAGVERPQAAPTSPLARASRATADWRRRLPPAADALGRAPDALARDPRMAAVEAVLFVAREPVTTRKLAQFAGLADGTEARTLIRRLNRWYDEAGSAFRAEEIAGGYQLLTRPAFSSWLRRLYQSPAEVRLSAPALETLAVVAYRQPVLRAQIEAIRGVDCGEILRQLMERDLVRTAGRADDLGRPYRYATTKRFLQVFGLKHLDDLPRAEVLRTPPTDIQPPAQLDPPSAEQAEGESEPK